MPTRERAAFLSDMYSGISGKGASRRLNYLLAREQELEKRVGGALTWCVPPLISCTGVVAGTWEAVIMVLVCFVTFTLPVQTAWTAAAPSFCTDAVVIWIIDVSFLFDIAMQFSMTYVDHDTQVEVWSRRRAAKRYLTNYRCSR